MDTAAVSARNKFRITIVRDVPKDTYFRALIDVSTVLSVGGEGVSCCAFAFEAPYRVPAPAVPAQERHHPAFVDVHAVVARTELESLMAVALVAPHLVDARTVVANAGMPHAFVHIHAGVSSGS